ncbi:hypothetical protein ACFOUP_15705 [Belliella kenyensis]|uniref:Uncharacterized protein n=1 Tax=Belliella kenyensis TaxID=1472724 RepID=A0ABV8ENJ0_9BACT|nr:hypothetical protein [Belliella kenyensis]MCH7401996.1 hypothetical protein [Belliella kenyensis]MDN3605160.1 hypothetical protein [Belliella kenyensis]
MHKSELIDQSIESTFIFHSNGTFEQEHRRTQGEGDFETGILSISTGIYAFENGELVVSTQTAFHAEVYENLPSTIEDLIDSDDFLKRTVRAKFSFENNFNAMILFFYECHDIITGGLSSCAEPTPMKYIRVEG